MYRKIAILIIAALVLFSVIQPASAAGGAIASKLADLRAQATNTAHPSPSPGAIASKLADIKSQFSNTTVRPTAEARPIAGTRAGELRLQATKAVVTNSIDAAVNSLNRFDTGISGSKLTDSQKAVINSRIRENISWFEGKIEAVKASTDIASVLSNASEASDRWDSVFPGLKKEAGSMAGDNVDATIVTARNASSVISGKISAMKAQGKDTTAIENALASYNGHVDSASVHAANARSEFAAISGKNDGHYAAGIQQLNQASKELKNAYSDLKKIYRLFYGNSVQVS